MRKFRVLVVDDEARILNFLISKLKACGYEVITAVNGLEGLEQAKAQEPDLIVLDLLMPKMNGLEMLKELRGFSTSPVIVLTAKGSDNDRIRGLQLGADDYLPKPFNPDELVARIEAIRRRLGPDKRRDTPGSSSSAAWWWTSRTTTWSSAARSSTSPASNGSSSASSSATPAG